MNGKGNRLAQNVSTKKFRDNYDEIDWRDKPKCSNCGRELAFDITLKLEGPNIGIPKVHCVKCGYVKYE